MAPAGDFDKYLSICDLKKNGWGVFRPEVYELKLMEYDADGKPVDSGQNKGWDECDGPEVPLTVQNVIKE